MTAIWKDIDPNQAESALRSLNRRLTDLDTALQAQAEILRVRPNSFAFKLGSLSLLEMQNRLRDERVKLLKHRVAEKLDIALDGGVFQKNSASIGALGTLLIRLQKLYSSIAQSIVQGPKLRGPIAANIIASTELRLASTFPSSFGMSLIVAPKDELFLDSLASTALEGLFALLDSLGDEQQAMRLSGEFGGRSINHLKHIATILGKNNSEVSLEWSDSAGIKHYWHASADKAIATLKRLESIKETRAESRSMTGRIVGASLLRNRFELMLDDGAVIDGKIASTAIDALTGAFGQICSVNIDETEITDHASGEVKTYYSLTDIHPLIEGQ
ncbi:MAG: hypothetical protein GC183_11725 [Thiobacillus sp.]|nr:hypothetical protein [Thiobacillus sp.]